MVRQAPPVDSPKNASIAAALEALRVNRPLRAEEICRSFLIESPGSVEHLRLLAHALQKQTRYPEAEKTLRLAISLQPEFPHLHEDLGSVLSLQQRFEEAVPSFETAIRLEPRLPLVRKKLGQALAELGRASEADEAFEEFFEQSPEKGRVALAMDHHRAGRKAEALETLRTALREHPDNVDAMRALANIYIIDKEHLGDAEALLRRATSLAPGFAVAWQMLGVLLHEAGRHQDAIECFRTCISLEPENAISWGGLAGAYAHVGDMQKSSETYTRALALNPKAAGHLMGHGHVLKSLGDQAGALRAYRGAIELRPELGEVYWSMANLKIFRFEDAEVAAMERQLANPELSENAQIHFRFALAKAYEDKRDYDAAWRYYETGNQSQRKTVFYDPTETEILHEKIAKVFSAEFLAKHAGAGHDSNAPIFVVGLPRSGSTLVEQILASHSQVEGTAELPVISRISGSIGRYRTDGKQYPESVLDLRGRDFRAYGKQYLDDARPWRLTDRPRFTDKLPNNFSHIGLIHLILPNAKIINARRHPFDSCLGSYKQLFGKGQHFTYDTFDLAMYYREYHEIMKHWHEVLPGRVLDVHYEETVADLETQVRRILDYCGLPFEQACVDFHKTQRAVRTASSEQVRQPLYTSGLGYWRNFEKHLGMWQESLGDIVDELPERVRSAGL